MYSYGLIMQLDSRLYRTAFVQLLIKHAARQPPVQDSSCTSQGLNMQLDSRLYSKALYIHGLTCSWTAACTGQLLYSHGLIMQLDSHQCRTALVQPRIKHAGGQPPVQDSSGTATD
jgi:hypothetical protein